ncbi:MAG: type II secretion system secretin GspD [Desulfobacteraceae bacterium]
MNCFKRLYVITVVVIMIGFSLMHTESLHAQATADKSAQLVSIDFNNVDIVVFIKFMSDLTKRNFVVDDKVRGKVTIISPGKITVDEAYHVFLSVLEVHGYTTVPSGKITKIVPSPDARSKNIRTRLEEESGTVGDNVVTQIIPLRYADPDEIKKLFTPLVSKSSVILAYTPTNTLIVTDVQSNIRRLQRILNAIDITGVGQQIAIIPVEYADASKLVTLLTSIFQKKARAKGAIVKEITFVADERTNSIVLLASEGDTDNIRKLIKSLDKETPRGQAKIHVYYLEHANAEELANVLKDIPQKDAAGKTPGKKTAPVVSDKVRISADKATNSLIIMADMEDYVVLENIIKKIDIPRAMVYIEALIMEVNITKDFRLGTEWVAGGEAIYEGREGVYGGGFSAGGFGGEKGTIGTTLAAAGAASLPAGFSLGLFGENITVGGITFPTIQAIIQAYKKDKDTNILSTPQILTTDNQEAKIYVGSNIPFQTQATANDAGSTIYNSFEYRDVGKTLKITPHISKDRMVRLELSLEVSSVAGTQTSQPTTLKRTVETTAIVKDRHTVVLGGLIDDQIDNTKYKVPCLGDIPGLGFLFSQKANTNDKTNLYVFLTPRVIQNPDEATEVSKEKRDHIDKIKEESIKLYDGEPAKETSRATPDPGVESFQYREDQEPLSVHEPQTQPAATDASASPDSGVNHDQSTPAIAPEPVKTDQASVQPTQTGATGEGGYTVQVASVPNIQEADQILKKLNDLGYAAYTVQSSVAEKTWFRVRIGFFEHRQSANQLIDRLKSDHYDPMLIKI